MARPLIHPKRAQALSSALILIGLATLFFFDDWWPAIMLTIGLPVALRQFLLGRVSDGVISLFVFVGFFIIARFDISWKILMPIFFTMAAVYVLCKEWVSSSTSEMLSEEENQEGSSEE